VQAALTGPAAATGTDAGGAPVPGIAADRPTPEDAAAAAKGGGTSHG
jgi:hypothetical protein